MILILILIIARTQKDSALEASRSTLYRQEGILDISRQFGELKLTIMQLVCLLIWVECWSFSRSSILTNQSLFSFNHFEKQCVLKYHCLYDLFYDHEWVNHLASYFQMFSTQLLVPLLVKPNQSACFSKLCRELWYCFAWKHRLFLTLGV